jgi:phosphatidylserine/phosphatidylglycerophosphate/cardiolipin synthase-like enzyme
MKDIEVYFENIHDVICRFLDESKKSIIVAVAWFTDEEIYKKLVDSTKRGVKVEVIIANHIINKDQKIDFKELLKSGANVQFIGEDSNSNSDRLMHNKFCIIDNEIIINGSCNWTYKSRMNDENVMVVKNNVGLIEKFNQQFYKISPKFCFSLENDKVYIKSIQDIIKKWDIKNEIFEAGAFFGLKEENDKKISNTKIGDIISKF